MELFAIMVHIVPAKQSSPIRAARKSRRSTALKTQKQRMLSQIEDKHIKKRQQQSPQQTKKMKFSMTTSALIVAGLVLFANTKTGVLGDTHLRGITEATHSEARSELFVLPEEDIDVPPGGVRKLEEFSQADCEYVDACNPGVYQRQRWTCWDNHNVEAGAGKRCSKGWVRCNVGTNPGIWRSSHWVCLDNRFLQTGDRCPSGWISEAEWVEGCFTRRR